VSISASSSAAVAWIALYFMFTHKREGNEVVGELEAKLLIWYYVTFVLKDEIPRRCSFSDHDITFIEVCTRY
jgi:hypothetical protein